MLWKSKKAITKLESVLLVLVIIFALLAGYFGYLATLPPQPPTPPIVTTVTVTITPPPPLRFSSPEVSPSEWLKYQEIFEWAPPELTGRIQFEPMPEMFHENILEMYEMGIAPDVFYLDSVWGPIFIEKNVIFPIEEFATKEFITGFYDFLLEPFIGPDGKVYGLPKEWSMLLLFYNKKLLAEAEFERPPETWSELVSYAKIITDKTAVAGLSILPNRFDFYMAYALSEGTAKPNLWIPNGEPPADDEVKLEWFKNPEVKKTLVDWINLYVEGKMEREAVGIEPYVVSPVDIGTTSLLETFGAQKAAMIISDNRIIPFLREWFPDFQYDRDWDIAPLPKGSKGRATIVYTAALAINSKTKEPRAAWKIVEISLNERGQETFLIPTGLALPSLKGLAIHPDIWPQQKKALEQIVIHDIFTTWFTGRKHVEIVPKLEQIMSLALAEKIPAEETANEMYKVAYEIAIGEKA